MRFNSLVYWAFLALVVIVVRAIPGSRGRKWWLLTASYIFYASWHWPYLLLLIGVVVLNHVGARWIVRAEHRQRRGAIVIAANLVLLALFKYLDWIIGNVNGIAGLAGFDAGWEPLDLVLPLGISFYLFQAMSYIIDLVRKREDLHSFGDFQLYIAYFPQLIAGPIMRAREFLPQLAGRWEVTAQDVRVGLRYVISGLFVKIVLADGLAPRVDDAFARSHDSLGTVDIWIMAVAFGLQIYFDFSAYSRIAIGSARLCGLNLVENFNFPYSAHSPPEFWARWHMSLSRWIRDYLFYPLASRNPGLLSLCRASLLAMTLCGLWHGAAWTFVLWGLYHGALITGYHLLTYRLRSRQPAAGTSASAGRILNIALTFALVSLGWLFFRAQDLSAALGLIGKALAPWGEQVRALSGTMYLHTALLTAAVWLIPVLKKFITSSLRGRRSLPGSDWGLPALEGIYLGALLALSLIYLKGQTAFIYFQF